MTTPAAETKSIGLLADAQLSWFLQHHLDSFTVTGQIQPIYRDSAIWTNLPGRENSCSSIGTLQKRMPTLTQTSTPHTCRAVVCKRKQDAKSCQYYGLWTICRDQCSGTNPDRSTAPEQICVLEESHRHFEKLYHDTHIGIKIFLRQLLS